MVLQGITLTEREGEHGMALFEGTFKDRGGSWIPKLLTGVGMALVAPIVVPALAVGLRPLVKAVIKGGMILYDKSQEVFAEASEQISDLMAEARAELVASAQAATAHAASTHDHATQSEGVAQDGHTHSPS
jgi:hypothetical protein